jgi:hypothetical protein
MEKDETSAQRLAAICMLGCVLINYPVLALFNQPRLIFGIPLLYAYMFAAWTLVVALVAFVARRRAG